jgi:hypothetical protein
MKTPLFGIMTVNLIVVVIVTLFIFCKSHLEYSHEDVETVTYKHNIELVCYLRYVDYLRIHIWCKIWAEIMQIWLCQHLCVQEV